MSEFQIHVMQDASILAVDDMRSEILVDPTYQRPGKVWNKKKKQLFIDSLLNRYDVPKLYFHRLEQKDSEYRYAIIDGRQRLEAIWSFLDNGFSLSDDFEYLDDGEIDARGMTYDELSKTYPKLITRLHSRTLTIMIVVAPDIDLVEDMFTRLNEAVPLNAAERRNAFGGPLPLIVRDLAGHRFFRSKVKISETRYRHHDILAKFLYLENSERIVDTKRASLDHFFREAAERGRTRQSFAETEQRLNENLGTLTRIFVDGDDLLGSSGMVVVYYVLFSRLRRDNVDVQFGRSDLEQFEEERAQNRQRFEADLDDIDRRLIEFDELAQSSNDASAIRERYEVIRSFLNV